MRKSKKKFFVALFIGVVLAFTMTACGFSTSSSEDAEQGGLSEEGPELGEITFDEGTTVYEDSDIKVDLVSFWEEENYDTEDEDDKIMGFTLKVYNNSDYYMGWFHPDTLYYGDESVEFALNGNDNALSGKSATIKYSELPDFNDSSCILSSMEDLYDLNGVLLARYKESIDGDYVLSDKDKYIEFSFESLKP